VTLLSRLRSFVFHRRDGRFLFWITLVALVIRLIWNIAIHSPGDFITSDMQSYWKHSDSMLKDPFRRSGTAVFFPYGPGTLFTLVRLLFGAQNHVALGSVYALLGTLLVPLVYRLAERFSPTARVPRIAAVLTCFYYPFISYGGYYLSELPFAVWLTAATLFTVRLADRGKPRDAWLTGFFVALGAIFRPQILVSLPVLFVLWFWRRKSWPKWRLLHWFRLATPVVLVLAFSAARFHYHTDRWGLISGNGPLNFAFGRCHALEIESRAVAYYASFSPPPMGYLAMRERRHPDSFIRLDPVVGTKVQLHGTMWSPETFGELTKSCIRVTGYARQLRYSTVHVIMLWGFNNAWPDSAQDPFRFFMLAAVIAHNIFLMPPLVIMLIASFRRRFSRQALIGAQIAAIVIVAMLYFGDVRLRVPYDGLAIVLALEGWRRIVGWCASGRWHPWR
jgi:4-amino-4-deoxy-L-arabinose transferase-like glycosyltransferase